MYYIIIYNLKNYNIIIYSIHNSLVLRVTAFIMCNIQYHISYNYT